MGTKVHCTVHLYDVCYYHFLYSTYPTRLVARKYLQSMQGSGVSLLQGSGVSLRQGSGVSLRQGSGVSLRQGSGVSLRQGSLGQHPHAVEDGPTDGSPSQLIA